MSSRLFSHLLGVVVLAFTPTVGRAQAPATPPPRLGTERVIVRDVPDVYAPVRETIRKLTPDSPQSYYVVVVRSAGRGTDATRDYLDRMVQDWADQALRDRIPFDTKRYVLIVLGEENRQIAVRGGTELRERFGFREKTIDRDLVRSIFLPHARRNTPSDYTRGVSALIEGIDRWIAERDGAGRRQAEEAKVRQARALQEAQTALSAASQAVGEARTELKTRRAAGLTAGPFETNLDRAEADLKEANRLVSTNAVGALRLAQETRRAAEGVRDRLQSLTARQAEVESRIPPLAARARQVEDDLTARGRAGLPIAGLKSRLESALGVIDAARQAMASDPEKAAELAGGADVALSAITRDAGRLETLVADARRQGDALRSAVGDFQTVRDRARANGEDTSRIDARYQLLASQVDLVGRPGTEPERIVRDAGGLESQVRGLIRDVDSLESDRRFRTRTVPAILLTILAVPVLLVSAILAWLGRSARRRYESEVKAFKEKSVTAVDRIDALKERHKLLPFTDPDYKEPMTGATQTQYAQVQDDLRRHYDAWLAMMETLEKAQSLVAAPGGKRRKTFDQAADLLKNAGTFSELESRLAECAAGLDRLERAHEVTDAALAKAEAAGRDLDAALPKLEEVDLPTGPFLPARNEVAKALETARAGRVADPLGTETAALEVVKKYEAVRSKVELVLDQSEEARKAAKTLETIGARIAEARGDGLRLDEPEGDPDTALAEARRHYGEALESLRDGDAEAATRAREAAEAAAARAGQALDNVLQARTTCRDALPTRRADSRALRARLPQAQADRETLRKSFAPESWRAVAGHYDHAGAALDQADALLDEAEADASKTTQHYLAACESLKKALMAQQAAANAFGELSAMCSSLAQARDESRAGRQALAQSLRRVDDLFRAHDLVVGTAAHRARNELAAILKPLDAAMQAALPNWPDLRDQLRNAQNALQTAESAAQADIAAQREFAGRLDSVREHADRLDGFLRAHSTDRPRANQKARAAFTSLEQLIGEAEAGRADWPSLAKRLQVVAEELGQAEHMAREDVHLAEQATSALNEAERQLRRARTFYEAGVSPDLRGVEQRLATAQSAFGAQNYEQAIEAAGSAEQAARQALDAATREAQRRRDAEEARRRAAMTPSVTPGHSPGIRFLETPRTSAPSVAASAPSPTSSTSWSGPSGSSSETSQTSW